MSNTDMFICNNDERTIIEFDIFSASGTRSRSAEQRDCIASEDHRHTQSRGREVEEQKEEENGDEIFEKDKENCGVSTFSSLNSDPSEEYHHQLVDKSKYSSSLGQGKIHEQDDDGFRTPASTEHKIPVKIECPPAPRKPKLPVPSTYKRKTCSVRRRNLRFDLFGDVESLCALLPSVIENLDPKLKRVRS